MLGPQKKKKKKNEENSKSVSWRVVSLSTTNAVDSVFMLSFIRPATT